MSAAVEKIMDEYKKIRLKNSNKKDRETEKIYREFPEIEKIDKEINLSGSQNVRKIINNPEKADIFNKEFKEKLERLNRERKNIIEKNNIDPNFDKIKYECEKCYDTGFLPDGKRCACFVKKLADYRYKRSNLSEILDKENFETFSFDFYPKEKNTPESLSPYENMKDIYNRAKFFCENFESEKKSLIFYGAAGLGKTFLSSCIAKELLDKGKNVLYLNAPRLFIIYEDYRFNRLDDESVIDEIYSSDLLIIDDLGTEPQTKTNLSFLFDLLNERLLKEKKMIISTNYNMNELTQMYSSRFTSRIYEYFLIYGFYGNDIRIEKLRKNI